MKFGMAWTSRINGSVKANEEAVQRALHNCSPNCNRPPA
jgi:hypothetical protein